VPLRHNLTSSLPATQHFRKWLDGISDAFAYCLRKLRQYAQAYTYRGLRALASLSMARSGRLNCSPHEALRNAGDSEHYISRYDGSNQE